MKKTTILLTLAAVAASMVSSCNDDSTIGQTIVQDKIEVIVDSSFTVSGTVRPVGKVQSRTVAQILGRIDAKGYGKISSDIVTQFMPSSAIDTENVTVEGIDSLRLYFFMSTDEYVGDTLVPMGIEVYRLNKALPSPIYSDFDPTDYYDPADKIGSAVYNISNITRYAVPGDTVYAEGVEIGVELPKELGKEIFTAYKDNPEAFKSPTAFVDNVFKGIYVKNSFGSGRLIRSSSTLMTLFYHSQYYDTSLGRDTIEYKEGNYFAVTPEIITNNDVSFQISPEMEQRIENGEKIVMGPVGTELEIQFPALEILDRYRSASASLSILNTLSFSVPGNMVWNDCNIGMPTYLLLVLANKKDEFFANNQLPDNETSFYATYDSETGLYDFGEMRKYLLYLLDKEEITPDDYTFVITPVSATFETSTSSYYSYYYSSSSTTLSMLTPYMAAPVMASLDLDNALIVLSFSTQTIEK